VLARLEGSMREGITVEVGAADRARLEGIASDRNSRQKHVWRARIVLLTADGVGTNEIMRRAGISNATVWRWQERLMPAGVAGLCGRGWRVYGAISRDRRQPRRCPRALRDLGVIAVDFSFGGDTADAVLAEMRRFHEDVLAKV